MERAMPQSILRWVLLCFFSCYCCGGVSYTPVAAAQPPEGAPQACVKMVMGLGNAPRLVNTCNSCRTAMVSDYYDGMKQWGIPRYGYIDLPLMFHGQLVSDHPC
jgi:hypothetical protein